MEQREEGRVVFFNTAKEFGFCAPEGTDAGDRTQNLFISGYALKRAGIATLNKHDKISFRKEISKHPGRRPECQDIRLLDEIAP
jgi:cold shock CspA family protein